MAKSEEDQVMDAINRFIDQANTLKDDGVDINVVSAALMSASCIYATYAAGGNEGGLTEKGIDKVAGAYRSELERIQLIKKQNAGEL